MDDGLPSATCPPRRLEFASPKELRPGDIFIHRASDDPEFFSPITLRSTDRELAWKRNSERYYLAIRCRTDDRVVNAISGMCAARMDGALVYLGDVPALAVDSVDFVPTGDLKSLYEIQGGEFFLMDKEIFMRAAPRSMSGILPLAIYTDPADAFSMSGFAVCGIPNLACEIMEMRAVWKCG